MIDMSQWEELVVDVVDHLRLDPNNVRLDLKGNVPEADIIHDLFKNDKVYPLLESIIRIGLLTHEVPIVIREKSDLVVVEGNRRVAALKTIQNPYLVPEYQARIIKLTRDLSTREYLRKITVKKAPNRDEADQLIAALHTGNQRVAWTPSRQAAFFQAQLDNGKTLGQLIEQYPTVKVKQFVTRSMILELFRSVSYGHPDLKRYVSSRNFPVSTLARLYDYDKFLKLLEIEIDEETATVRLGLPRAQFERIAEKIISDIHSRKIDTRALNKTTSDSYKNYMDELRDLLNEPVGMGNDPIDETQNFGAPPFESAATGSDQERRPPSGEPERGAIATDQQPSPPTTTSTNPPPRKSPYLDTNGIEIPSTFARAVHLIFQELSSINLQRFPNATFDLLRTFLEKAIKAYAESIGEEIKNFSNQGNGYVQLFHCLNWLEQHFRTTNQRALIQVVVKIRDGRISKKTTGWNPTLDSLNAVNHNHNISVSPDDVRDCWQTMESALKGMLGP